SYLGLWVTAVGTVAVTVYCVYAWTKNPAQDKPPRPAVEGGVMEGKDRDEKNREALRADERVRYQWMLETLGKFRLFFAGLVFAMLSFSVQFSIVTANRAVTWCQFAAWLLLLVTGALALRDAGG